MTTTVAPSACSRGAARRSRARAAVEVAGRLVGEHDRRLARPSPGDGDPLALAAGQPARAGGPHGGRGRPVRGIRSPGGAGARRHARVQQRQGDVVERAHPLDEVELLEDEADHRPRRPTAPVAERRHVVAVEHTRPDVGRPGSRGGGGAWSCPSPRDRRWPATRRVDAQVDVAQRPTPPGYVLHTSASSTTSACHATHDHHVALGDRRR